MIVKSDILWNLKTMNRKYDKSKNPKEALFYAKMAIMELSGWTEESMDDIVSRCANKNLKKNENKEYVKNEVIKRTYGFAYNKDFLRMMTTVIGLIAYEKLEKSLDPVKLQRLKSELGNLRTKRDAEAHTHIEKTRRINAPSVTIRQFGAIYEGLLDIDHNLKKMKLL